MTCSRCGTSSAREGDGLHACGGSSLNQITSKKYPVVNLDDYDRIALEEEIRTETSDLTCPPDSDNDQETTE